MFQKLVSSSEGVRAEGITEGQQRGMHCCLPENQERSTFITTASGMEGGHPGTEALSCSWMSN